jgi:hypothetical protein
MEHCYDQFDIAGDESATPDANGAQLLLAAPSKHQRCRSSSSVLSICIEGGSLDRRHRLVRARLRGWDPAAMGSGRSHTGYGGGSSGRGRCSCGQPARGGAGAAGPWRRSHGQRAEEDRWRPASGGELKRPASEGEMLRAEKKPAKEIRWSKPRTSHFFYRL